MCLHCCRNRHHGNCYFLLLRKAITPQPFHGVSPHLCLQAASSVFFCLHTRFNHMLFISACISGVLFLYWLMLQLIFLHAPSFASLEETFPPLSDGVNQALSGLGCNVGSCSFFFSLSFLLPPVCHHISVQMTLVHVHKATLKLWPAKKASTFPSQPTPLQPPPRSQQSGEPHEHCALYMFLKDIWGGSITHSAPGRKCRREEI